MSRHARSDTNAGHGRGTHGHTHLLAWEGAAVIDLGAPANAPDLFADPGAATGGPCLLEPELGSQFPRN